MSRKNHDVSRHHRKPKSLGGVDDNKNISIVRVTEHRAWHTLFQNYTPEIIVKIINEIWLDPNYKFFVKRSLYKDFFF